MTGRLVKDINASGSSSPTELIDIDGVLYFVADSGNASPSGTTSSETEDDSSSPDSPTTSSASGIGLWKSDGSEGGTRLVASFDGISNLVEANGLLYFIGKTGENYDIWSSDGTSSGTQKVDAFYPGSDNFSAYNLFAVDDTLFFSASGPAASTNGYELWRWQGNDVGTKLFKNLFPDRYITEQSTTIETDSDGNPLLDGDGNPIITLTIKTAEFNFNNPEFSPDSFPSNFTEVSGGNFFFTAYSTYLVDPPQSENFADEYRLGGIELWFSDGTENGTYAIPINNQPYTIYDPVDGSSTPGSLIQSEVNYIAKGSSFPKNLTTFNNDLYFSANDGLRGFELWRINNQGVGESIVKDIHPNGSSAPEELTVVGNKLYFTADDGDGRKLWVVNTSDQAKKVENSGTNPRNLAEVDGKLYYSASSDQGREPWVIENNNSAKQLQDINPGSGSSNPNNFKLIKRETKKGSTSFLYFSANDGERGIELWSQNLSNSENKAERYADIYSGPPSSDPRHLTNSNDKLFFTANDGKTGRELWTIGPGIEGPSGSIGAGQSTIEVIENTTFVYTFGVNLDSSETIRWSINGGLDSKLFTIEESTGTLSFKDAPDYEQPQDFTRDNNYEVIIRVRDDDTGLTADQAITVVVVDDPELQPCDGSNVDNCIDIPPPVIESDLVKNIREGSKSSDPEELFNHRGRLFFSANNGRNGHEPWVSSGTTASTSLFLDINKGKRSSSPSSFTTYKTSLFFAADNGRQGSELWISNGKDTGTKLVADIQRGEGSSSPSDLLVLGKTLYMAADDGLRGRELWRYNLKSGENSLVRDIRTGSRVGSSPSELTSLNGKIIFAAEGDSYGRELWISDGSQTGTEMLQDINPGGLNSDPKDFSHLDGDLYFTASTYLNGRQILKLDGSGLTITEVSGSLDPTKAMQPSELHASRDQLFFSAETTLDPTPEPTPSTPSTEGGSTSGSDPGGFMIAADGISTDAAGYINSYNRRIDNYRDNSDIDWLEFAKTSADFLLDDFDNPDASLAEDWNKYFQKVSGLSPLQIPDGIPSTAARRSTTSSPGGGELTPSPDNNSNGTSLGRELWMSNGRTNGNILLKDIYPGAGSSNPRGFHTVGTKTYFSADNGQSGEELWVTDGTTGGTYMISDINQGSKDSSPRSITDLDGVIYFSAKSEEFGRELYRLGPPPTGTVQPQDPDVNIPPTKAEDDLTRLVYSSKGKGQLRGKRKTTDEFIFNRPKQFGASKADQITRFSVSEGDSIQLDKSAFPGLNQRRRRFKVAATLQDFNRQLERESQIIYFEPFGELYFDQNGREPGLGEAKNSGLFAILKGAPELTRTDIGVL